VVNVTVESLTVIVPMLGAWLSLLLTLIATEREVLLPAASVKVTVTVSLVVPNE
jgi:hypothetical protein